MISGSNEKELDIANQIADLLLEKEKLQQENKQLKEKIDKAIELIKRSAGYKGICTQPETDTFSTLLEILGVKKMNNEDDLIYSYEELEDLVIKYQNINNKLQQRIDKTIEYIKEHKEHEYRNGNDNEYYLELNEKEMEELLKILGDKE